MANKPEKTFRIGYVSASVFVNHSESGSGRDKSVREFRNVQLQRSYKDGTEWKTSNTFGLSDLPSAIRVLELALHHVEEKEADVTS